MKILQDDGGFKLLCIQDEALTGSKVIAQKRSRSEAGPGDGLFHGTGRVEQRETCPLYQRLKRATPAATNYLDRCVKTGVDPTCVSHTA